jgi:hypothetical protein
MKMKDKKMTIIGDVDPVDVVKKVRAMERILSSHGHILLYSTS